MFEQFPYANFHELNMDWIVKIAKDFLDQYTHIQETISNGEESLQNLTQEELAALGAKAEELKALLQAWYDTHSEDIAQELTTAVQSFNTQADEKAREARESIPADYTALSDSILDVAKAIKLSDIDIISDMQSGYISYADINTVVQNTSWKCAKIEVHPGLKCRVKGSGGSAWQLWMVFDENAKALIYSGNMTRTASYQDFIIPPSGKWLILNHNITEESLYPFSAVMGYPNTPDTVKKLTKYTIDNRNVSTFTTSAGSSDWYWLTNNEYPQGYIDHVRLYGTDESVGHNAYVAIYDKRLEQCVFTSDAVLATSKIVDIPVNAYFEHPVYVCARLKYLAHTKTGSNHEYANMWQFAKEYGDGAVFPIDWKTADNYVFAIECWYNTDYNADTLKYTELPNKIFLAGDSITAGYPYTADTNNYLNIPALRWGEQLARRYGFEVTYGAETGGGWISLPSAGSRNAITIADSTDFSAYNTVVFAFGTNDYNANIPLGNISDMYPSQKTVCGSMNYIIRKVHTDNPKAVFIVSSPINRSDKGSAGSNYGYGTANNAGYTLLDLVHKMKELCTAYNICFIDNSVGPFNRYNLPSLTVEGLHPNIDGYHVLGPVMAERIAQFALPFVELTKSIK